MRANDQYQIYQHLAAKALIGGKVSINDLREWDYKGKQLNVEQQQALRNFDSYRLYVLNKQKSEKKFHLKYLEIQVMANLSPYEEFLKKKYVTT